MAIKSDMSRRLLRAMLLLSLSLLFVGHTGTGYGQRRDNDRAARKFDEYKLKPGEALDEAKRLARFAGQLKLEPQTEAYVIAYGPRVLDKGGSSYWDIAKNRLLATLAELADHYGISESRLTLKDGGIREEATVEFWILPVGAKPPEPRPEFKSGDVVTCYPVGIDEYEFYVLKRELPLKFSASFQLGKPDRPVTFRWTVSAGKIIAGQGTSSISVDVNEAAIKSVTATVEVEGLPAECNEQASRATAIGVTPYKLFEFEEQYSEALKIHLDYLAGILHEQPELQGYIIIYGARNGRRGFVALRRDAARDYLTLTRDISSERFKLVEGGYREKQEFEIWVLPRGMSPPPATPTVDERYVRLIAEPGASRKRNRR
jgi:hypothetical protein